MHLYWLPAGTCSAGKHVALTSSDTRNTCGSVWVATVPRSRASWIKHLCLVHVHHTVRYRQKHGYSHPIFELHPLTIIISWSPWYINNITGLWIPFFCLERKNVKKCLALNVSIWFTPNTYNLYCRVSLNVHFCLRVCVCIFVNAINKWKKKTDLAPPFGVRNVKKLYSLWVSIQIHRPTQISVQGRIFKGWRWGCPHSNHPTFSNERRLQENILLSNVNLSIHLKVNQLTGEHWWTLF